jgi:hypothetical protein
MLITLLKSVAAGLLMATLLLIPFLGPFTVGLLLIPVCFIPHDLVQQFCSTGDQVDFGFAWITLHTKAPFFFYWGWYTLLSFALFLFLQHKRRK